MRKKNRALSASILLLMATIMTSMVMMIVEEYLNVRKTRSSRNNLNIVKRKNTVYIHKGKRSGFSMPAGSWSRASRQEKEKQFTLTVSRASASSM